MFFVSDCDGFLFFLFQIVTVFLFLISDCDGFLFFQFQIVTVFFH